MELNIDLEDGRPVTVEYEFDEGDSSVGLNDDFEITVTFEGKDITNDLNDTDNQAIREAVAKDFGEYIEDCKADAAADQYEAQIADREWNDHYGY